MMRGRYRVLHALACDAQYDTTDQAGIQDPVSESMRLLILRHAQAGCVDPRREQQEGPADMC
jgi:hypothetical protein